jgi:hypothetical protein
MGMNSLKVACSQLTPEFPEYVYTRVRYPPSGSESVVTTRIAHSKGNGLSNQPGAFIQTTTANGSLPSTSDPFSHLFPAYARNIRAQGSIERRLPVRKWLGSADAVESMKKRRRVTHCNRLISEAVSHLWVAPERVSARRYNDPLRRGDETQGRKPRIARDWPMEHRKGIHNVNNDNHPNGEEDRHV